MFLPFFGCQVFDKDEDIPAWINIDKFELIDNPEISEGALTEEITDVWISLDGNRLGTFELPARIPVLEAGEHEIVVSPGIIVSGVSALRTDYLYYSKDTFILNFAPGGEFDLEPQIRYVSSELQELIVLEDFEDGDTKLEIDESSNASFAKTTNPEFVEYGSGCGILYLNDTVTYARFKTSGTLSLPQNGSVFLEIDIKYDYNFNVGLHVNSANRDADIFIVEFNARDDVWRKFYIALDQTLNEAYALHDPIDFHIYFEPLYGSSSVPRTGEILIDNVKVLFVP